MSDILGKQPKLGHEDTQDPEGSFFNGEPTLVEAAELAASLAATLRDILFNPATSDRRKLDRLTWAIITTYAEAMEAAIPPEDDTRITGAVSFAVRVSAEARMSTEIETSLEVVQEGLARFEGISPIGLADVIHESMGTRVTKLAALATRMWVLDQLPIVEIDDMAPTSFLELRRQVLGEAPPPQLS